MFSLNRNSLLYVTWPTTTFLLTSTVQRILSNSWKKRREEKRRRISIPWLLANNHKCRNLVVIASTPKHNGYTIASHEPRHGTCFSYKKKARHGWIVVSTIINYFDPPIDSSSTGPPFILSSSQKPKDNHHHVPFHFLLLAHGSSFRKRRIPEWFPVMQWVKLGIGYSCFLLLAVLSAVVVVAAAEPSFVYSSLISYWSL